MELRGLVGVIGGMGQGSVLLPWLLKPEVAVEEGEKPPPTRAEKKTEGWNSESINWRAGARKVKFGNEHQCKPFDGTSVLIKRLLLWCVASSSAVTSDNLHLQWSCWLCGWLGLLHVLLWLACGGWQ